MNIDPVYRAYWSSEDEEMYDPGDIIGYRVTNDSGTVIGFGETPAEATQMAWRAIMPIES